MPSADAPATLIPDDEGDVQNPTDADRASKFVRKLYQMVCNPQIDDHITWTPNGDAIQILRPAAFARDVLPLYFKHSNMRSFIRQLNMYGFRRRGKGSRVIEFVHRRFQRGNERDLATISRNHAAADDTAPTDADASAVHALQGEVQRMTTVIEEMRSRIFALEQAMSGKIGLLAGGGPQQPSCGPPLHGNPTAIAGATAVGGGWGAPPTPQWVYVPPAPSAQVLAGQPPPLFAQGANTVQGMHMSSQGRAVAADRIAVVVNSSAGMAAPSY